MKKKIFESEQRRISIILIKIKKFVESKKSYTLIIINEPLAFELKYFYKIISAFEKKTT